MIKTLIPQKPLTQSKALYYFAINQFATPGLGSLLGGRLLPALGQLALSIIGFFLVVFWFFQTMKAYYATLTSDSVESGNIHYLVAGALFFGAAWLWSLVTSISLLQEAKANELKNGPTMPPPRITNPPPKM